MRLLRRRRWLIAACAFVVVGSTLVFSLTQQKEYRATASILFRDLAVDRSLFQSAATPDVDLQRQAATNLKLVSLPDVADHASDVLGGTPTGAEIQSKIAVSGEGNSDIVSVTATDGAPAVAARLANVFATQFIAIRREADQAAIRNAQALVEKRLQELAGANRRALEARADDLKILAALQTGKAELVQRARIPGSPSAPKPGRNVLLGAVLGLILGIGLALLADRLDRRLRDPRELADAYRLPILAAIPEHRLLHNPLGRGALHPSSDPYWEEFRKLRAKLRYFNVDRKVVSVLITSAVAGEGKTGVASGLALAAATTGETKVLLLEADLRQPMVAQRLGLRSRPGLAELLTHGIKIRDAVQSIPLPSSNGSGASLRVIVAGTIPPNPSELLESQWMSELLGELSAAYDLVVIDSPPASLVADAMPLMQSVDGVIAVAQPGVTTRDQAHHLSHELDTLGAPTLGLVVNRVKLRPDAYYGYGYTTPSAERPTLERVT